MVVKAKSYMEQRHAATEGFGTEKRLRINNTLREPVMAKNVGYKWWKDCEGGKVWRNCSSVNAREFLLEIYVLRSSKKKILKMDMGLIPFPHIPRHLRNSWYIAQFLLNSGCFFVASAESPVICGMIPGDDRDTRPINKLDVKETSLREPHCFVKHAALPPSQSIGILGVWYSCIIFLRLNICKDLVHLGSDSPRISCFTSLTRCFLFHMKFTPPKTNMEPKHVGFEDEFSFPNRWFSGSMLIFWGVSLHPLVTHRCFLFPQGTHGEKLWSGRLGEMSRDRTDLRGLAVSRSSGVGAVVQ